MEKKRVKQFLEERIEKELEELKKSKDVSSFLENVGFYDEENIIIEAYEKISSLTEDDIERLTGGKLRLKQRIFADVMSIEKTFKSRKKVREWFIKKFPDYKQYTTKSVSYIEFLRLLLEKTGNSKDF